MEDDLDDYRPRSPSPFASTTDAEVVEPHFQHREYRGSVSDIPLNEITKTDLDDIARTPGHRPPQRNFNSQPSQPPPPPPQLNNFSFPGNNNPSFNPFAHNQALQPQVSVMKHDESYEEADEYRPERQQRPASRNKKVKTEEAESGVMNNAPGVAEGIEVKTKFPVARIKRIMQADEDVGKVAQVTPVAVSKALELFMISLVTKSASEARARGSKRVTAAHLKQAVQKEEQFDFLTEIVGKVPDAPAPRAKEDDSDEPMDGVGKKKRGAPRRKRKGSEEC
ncbi:cbf nf-y family transcription factor [Venturia nashicola]|uniref:NCT transcriptional regulatory complex subunit A n=1 Tax=Venturia nashicola TaxID=86259 RepID=A0A4Z1NJG4_9PEZI|nr:cbf nf-y family transcription factor [Venturia nashicola]TLD20923.1 cbf nf-y family transcription factor [Venturia nashicola]